MPYYEVTFKIDMAETVRIEADSLEDAQEEVRDWGYWRLSECNVTYFPLVLNAFSWEVTKQYDCIEEAEQKNES